MAKPGSFWTPTAKGGVNLSRTTGTDKGRKWFPKERLDRSKERINYRKCSFKIVNRLTH